MKTAFMILFLGLSTCFAYAQQSVGISHSFSISSRSVVYDKATGKRISEDSVEALIRRPEAAFHRYFDERGNPSHFVYDASIKAGDIHFYNPEERPEPGSDFPPFIMKTIDQKELSSGDMKGQIVVLNFQLMLQGPLFRPDKIAAFEAIVSNVKAPVKAIYITSSSAPESQKARQRIPLMHPVVASAHNFREKYKVADAQTYIVIDAAGKLAGYADNEAELEQLITKASR